VFYTKEEPPKEVYKNKICQSSSVALRCASQERRISRKGINRNPNRFIPNPRQLLILMRESSASFVKIYSLWKKIKLKSIVKDVISSFTVISRGSVSVKTVKWVKDTNFHGVNLAFPILHLIVKIMDCVSVTNVAN